MSRIARIETSIHSLALDRPFPAAWDPQPRRSFPVAVYRVFDDEGRMGIGAGDVMRGLVDYVDLFIGRDPLDLERHAEVLDNISFLDGRPWPLDMAIWDLAGKIHGIPIWRMIGGQSNLLRLYASSGTHWPLEEVSERVSAVVDAGFEALKIRFGRPSIEADLEVLAAVREEAGDRLAIMVDCNQGWRMPWDTKDPWAVDQAIGVARRLREYDVHWMEEPLHRGDYPGMRRLREETGIRVAGGEMTRAIHEFHVLLADECLDVYQPDVAVTGGFHRLASLAHHVVEYGAAFSPHTWGSGLALVANAHLTAGTVGTDFLEYPFDPPEWTPSHRDFLIDGGVGASEGSLQLGDRPGLGVELDEDVLADTVTNRARYD